MTQFETQKQAIIESIENQETFLNNIIQSNSHLGGLISREHLDKMRDISTKNKTFLHKLKSGEFEIAIVGLEKAGKSTFANALIDNNILPSAPERCTYTSTRLVSGNDQATVEFYSKAEFNQIFVNLLEELKYPDAQNQHFDTLSQTEFETYFDSLEEANPELYKHHIGKTNEEVLDILQCRNKLILDTEPKLFSGEQLSTEEFQVYIKGENGDKSKPHSVKKITIESAKLNKLKSAIIYDVPGFDSPTKIHTRQTEERLKKADAIILVTNVGRNPSIQGTSLNIINKNSDEDGIALKDKLFVFGNQLDMANSLEQSERNTETLKTDVVKYNIGLPERVFTGSALKYLSDNKKATDSYKENYKINANVDEIREALTRYYETDRFEILKRKIHSNKQALIDIFSEIIHNAENDFSNNMGDEGEISLITREAYCEIEAALEHNLQQLKFELKTEINEEKYFSQKFSESVETLNYFSPITEEELKQLHIINDQSLTADTPIERINSKIREHLHIRFLEQFTHLIHHLTSDKTKEIENRILTQFTNSIILNNSVDYGEIETECKKIIHNITNKIAHNEFRFDYLVERFSRDLFDILMLYPLGSNDREDKYNQASKEFEYLDNYYQGNGELISIILTQSKKNIFDNIEESSDTGKDIMATLMKGAKFYGTPSFSTGIALLKDLKGYFAPSEISQLSKDATHNVTRSRDMSSLLTEINVDIENLRDILKTAVIPAINLELSFFNSIDKQIKLLITAFNEKGNANAKNANIFLAKIVPIVKKNEIENINAKAESRKIKQDTLEQIKAFIQA